MICALFIHRLPMLGPHMRGSHRSAFGKCGGDAGLCRLLELALRSHAEMSSLHRTCRYRERGAERGARSTRPVPNSCTRSASIHGTRNAAGDAFGKLRSGSSVVRSSTEQNAMWRSCDPLKFCAVCGLATPQRCAGSRRPRRKADDAGHANQWSTTNW